MQSRRLGTYEQWQFAHASTPASVLTRLVHEATGSDIAHVRRIIEGYSNEVYRVGCTDGEEIVVRILRFDDDVSLARSTAEAWAIEQARGAGVMTGEVLHVGSVDLDRNRFPVLVQRAVPGRPLACVLDGLSDDQHSRVVRQIGAQIALLGSVGVSLTSGWASASAATVDTLRTDPSPVVSARATPEQVDTIVDRLDAYVRYVEGQPMVLAHGDLSTKHIFVQDSADGPSVSGLIDFGDWAAAPRSHDLAVLRVRSPELSVAPLIDGYHEKGLRIRSPQLDLHTLLVAVDAWRFHTSNDDPIAAAVIIDLTRELITAITRP